MKRRSLLLLPMLGLATFMFAAPAMAAYIGDGGIDVSDATPSAGDSITVNASGFCGAGQVSIALDSTALTTVTADSSGVVDTSVLIPSTTTEGSHALSLTGSTCAGAPRTLTGTITVSGGSSGSLPRTGAALAALLGVAGILIASGMVLSRARRRAATD